MSNDWSVFVYCILTNQMDKNVYTSIGLIREFHTGLRGNPKSMLQVFFFLICTLSLILLSLHLLALSTTVAASQSILWLVLMQWTALAFVTSPSLTHSLVLSDPCLKWPPRLSNVNFVTLCTRDLVHHSLVYMLLWSFHPCE